MSRTDDCTYPRSANRSAATSTRAARVARAYHDAWTNRKGSDALRELMGEEFVFDSAMMHIQGREQFLAGLAGPAYRA